MNRHHVAAAALALLLTTAGCVGGLTGAESAEEEPVETPVEVRDNGGRLAEDVDPNRIYNQAHELRGADATRTEPVALEVGAYPDDAGVLSTEATRFQELWGFDPHDLEGTSVAGWARPGQVRVFTEVVTTPTEQRSTLAHEYLHLIQFRNDAGEQVQNNVEAVGSNQLRVRWAVIEGAARWFEAEYMTEYHGVTRDRSWRDARKDRSAYGRYLIAVYFFGARYVEERVDDPANLDRVYENPPQTTEQIVHGDAPDEEPPRPLDVTAETDDSDWSEKDARTKGELFVRLTLESELSVERAREAAAGWGGDEANVFWISSEDRYGYTWTLRWDDASEADEFQAAMADYLDARGDRANDGWTDGETTFRLVRASEETVVVVAGDDGFVENASISGTGGTYTVTLGNESDTTVAGAAAAARTGTPDAAFQSTPPTPDTAFQAASRASDAAFRTPTPVTAFRPPRPATAFRTPRPATVFRTPRPIAVGGAAPVATRRG